MAANGFAIIADSYVNPREYVKPSDVGFVSDLNQIRGDVVVVGNDMKKAINKYGGSYRVSRGK